MEPPAVAASCIREGLEPAQRFSVPWLSLVENTDTRLVRRVLLNLQDTGAFPTAAFQVGDTSLVSQEEALARYQATLDK